MKLSYMLPSKDEEVLKTAEQILDVLTRSGLSYQQAEDALTNAQEMLGRKTRPEVIANG